MNVQANGAPPTTGARGRGRGRGRRRNRGHGSGRGAANPNAQEQPTVAVRDKVPQQGGVSRGHGDPQGTRGGVSGIGHANGSRGGRHAGSAQRGGRKDTAIDSQRHQLVSAARGHEERSYIRGTSTEEGQDRVERKPRHIPNCERHPNGEYWIRIHEVEEVYSRVSHDSSHFVMPLHCYGKRTANAYVSQLDVQRAIDNWDSDGLSDPEHVTTWADLVAPQIQPARRGLGDRAHGSRDHTTRRGSRDGKPTSQPNCGPHPNGEYWIRVCDVSEVYGDVCPIPYRLLGDTNEYVHAGAVRYASDQWDAEGILEDIDTQWGMIPEGGALDYCGFGSD